MTFRALAAPYPDAATFRSRGAPRPQHLDGQHRVAGRAGDLNRALSVIPRARRLITDGDVAGLIRWARQQHGCSQADLGKAAGYSASAAWRPPSGRRPTWTCSSGSPKPCSSLRAYSPRCSA